MVYNYFKQALPLAALAAMITFSAQLKAQENSAIRFLPQNTENLKFHFDVTGYKNLEQTDIANGAISEEARTREFSKGIPNATPVTFDVYDDFHFNVLVPANHDNYDQLNAGGCTINAYMKGVQTLGLGENETRSFSKDAIVGYYIADESFAGWMNNIYGGKSTGGYTRGQTVDGVFPGVICPVTIKDGDGTSSFAYSISPLLKPGDNNYPGIDELTYPTADSQFALVGTPNNSEAARAAWHKLTSHIRANQGEDIGGARLIFAKGAYLSLGTERLDFYNTVTWDPASNKALNESDTTFRYNGNYTATPDTKLTAYLPAGSTFGLSSSAAVLTQDVTITADFSSIQNAQVLLQTNNGKLIAAINQFLKQDDKVTKMMNFMTTFNAVIGAVRMTRILPFEVTFKSNPDITNNGTGNGNDDQNLTQLEGKNYVNATLNRNIKASGKWYTLCVPFGIPADQLKAAFGDDVDVEVFDKVITTNEGYCLRFKRVYSVEPGVSYIIKVSVPFSSYTFTDVPVSNKVIPSYVYFDGIDAPYLIKGTENFLDEDIYENYHGRGLFFSGSTGLELIKPIKSCVLYATRSYFVVPENTAGLKTLSINTEDGETTAIENVFDDSDNTPSSVNIYNLIGQRIGNSVNDLSRGVYIQNGKKFIVK